jgi:hypothetical protein
MDVAKLAGAPFQRPEFVHAFFESLSKGAELIQAIDNLSDEDLEKGAQGTLASIAAVVRAYTRKKNVKVNANYYVSVQPSTTVLENARFCRHDRILTSFRCFLVLKQWAHAVDALPQALTLPVECCTRTADGKAGNDPLLFGAPWSFAHNEPYLVSDTGEIWRHVVDHNEAVRREVGDYFRSLSSEIRSFVSIPIPTPAYGPYIRRHEYKQPVLGVVNVQSSRRALLGVFPGNQAKVRLALAPLIQNLSYYVLRLHFKDMLDLTPPNRGCGTKSACGSSDKQES